MSLLPVAPPAVPLEALAGFDSGPNTDPSRFDYGDHVKRRHFAAANPGPMLWDADDFEMVYCPGSEHTVVFLKGTGRHKVILQSTCQTTKGEELFLAEHCRELETDGEWSSSGTDATPSPDVNVVTKKRRFRTSARCRLRSSPAADLHQHCR